MSGNVAIIGASANRSKFGNKSLRAHRKAGYHTVPIHPTAKQIEGLEAYPSLHEAPVDQWFRISVYLPPHLTLNWLDELNGMAFEQLWLNPGSEDEEVRHRIEELGIDPIYGCSIVDLGTTPTDFPD